MSVGWHRHKPKVVKVTRQEIDPGYVIIDFKCTRPGCCHTWSKREKDKGQKA